MFSVTQVDKQYFRFSNLVYRRTEFLEFLLWSKQHIAVNVLKLSWIFNCLTMFSDISMCVKHIHTYTYIHPYTHGYI